jgi:O-antigen/teichoic acid export membrane protein
MLRFFTVLGIVTSGLQVVMAEQAASALTPEGLRDLAGTTRSIARTILVIWVLVLIACLVAKDWLLDTLKISTLSTLGVTLGLVLAQLFLPFVQGLLQGRQKFSWLGWSIMMNGAGRFAAIFLLLLVLQRNATTALAGALAGLAGAVLLGVWASRDLFFSAQTGAFNLGLWLRRAIPLSVGSGSLLFLMNADVLFVQAHFSRDHTAYYSAVAVLGIGLFSFTTPMAAVMFPKLVRSTVQAQKSDSLLLALLGTAVLGLCGAIFLTLFPSLPLKILFFKNPNLLESAQLVPWFMWSMLPVTLANVVVGALLARRDFRPVPWLALIALAYGFELNRYLDAAQAMNIFTAFKGVILRLGLFSGLMLAVAVLFKCRPSKAEIRARHP